MFVAHQARTETSQACNLALMYQKLMNRFAGCMRQLPLVGVWSTLTEQRQPRTASMSLRLPSVPAFTPKMNTTFFYHQLDNKYFHINNFFEKSSTF